MNKQTKEAIVDGIKEHSRLLCKAIDELPLEWGSVEFREKWWKIYEHIDSLVNLRDMMKEMKTNV